MKNEVLLKICDMIASGEIPKEVYNKYLGDTPIGFMKKYEIEKFLIKEQNKNRGKWWEDRLHFLLERLIQNCAVYAVEHYIDYNDKERLAKEYAHRINLWMVASLIMMELVILLIMKQVKKLKLLDVIAAG